jgi:hypothetical protein
VKYLIQLWKNILENFFKTYQNTKNVFILYKIVDSEYVNQIEYYKIQCINTKAIIQLTVEEIAFDLTILHGLHPIQGCFVGIEYSKAIKNMNNNDNKRRIKSQKLLDKYSVKRYGNNNLEYQDRNGRLGFRHCSTDETFLMDPRDIALSRELIEEFDAAQAFCIGVLAGLKFGNSVPIQCSLLKETKANHLWIVK